jgi:hypothetical protein
MVKLIIFAVLGLLVGVGGGSALAVMKAKTAFAAGEAERAKTVADSLASAAEHGPRATPDSVAHAGAASESADTSHALAAESTVVAHAGQPVTTPSAPRVIRPPTAADVRPVARDTAHDPKAASRKTTVESHGEPSTVGTTAPRVARPSVPPVSPAATVVPPKLAKIFGAMAPKDAAKVLEQLEDAEIQAIVGGLSDKQAAAIMQQLSPQRAAAISRAALRNGVREP